jgi:hypothetical protein
MDPTAWSVLFWVWIANHDAEVLAAKRVVEIFDRELAAGAVTGVDGGIISMNLLTDRNPLVEELD